MTVSEKAITLLPSVGAVKFREPRQYTNKNGDVKYDSPQGQVRRGELTVAVGTLALAFASRSI